MKDADSASRSVNAAQRASALVRYKQGKLVFRLDSSQKKGTLERESMQGWSQTCCRATRVSVGVSEFGRSRHRDPRIYGQTAIRRETPLREGSHECNRVQCKDEGNTLHAQRPIDICPLPGVDTYPAPISRNGRGL
jgi:hypothetical protein